MALSEKTAKQLRDAGLDPADMTSEQLDFIESSQDIKNYPTISKVFFSLALFFFFLAAVYIFIPLWDTVIFYVILGGILAYLGNQKVKKNFERNFIRISNESNSLKRMEEREFLEIDAQYSDDPDMARTMKSAYLISVGAHLGNEGKILDAKEAFLRAISIDKNNLGARVALAMLYEGQGLPPFDRIQVLEATPKTAFSKASSEGMKISFLVNLGNAYYEMGNKKKALALFKRALSYTKTQKYKEDERFRREYEKHTGETVEEEYSPKDIKDAIIKVSAEID